MCNGFILLRLREYLPSHLAFHQQSDKDDTEVINYLQSQSDWLEEVFGCVEAMSKVIPWCK